MSSSSPAAAPTRRWRLDLAYDGSTFRGWAAQPGVETVAGTLAETLARTLRLEAPPTVVAAGRTDAGVHALGQVVHVDLPDPLFADGAGPERLVAALNHQLAGRVAVLAAAPAPPGFDARFSATWRAYRYLVVESDAPGLGVADAWGWAVPGPLDVAAMNRAGAPAVGSHDFRAFCRRPARADPAQPLTREVLSLAWREAADDLALTAGARTIRLDVVARSFCHQMVRSLAGALVAVGRGRLGEGEVAARLADPRRDHLPAPAPASGLCLLAVGYDDASLGRLSR